MNVAVEEVAEVAVAVKERNVHFFYFDVLIFGFRLLVAVVDVVQLYHNLNGVAVVGEEAAYHVNSLKMCLIHALLLSVNFGAPVDDETDILEVVGVGDLNVDDAEVLDHCR